MNARVGEEKIETQSAEAQQSPPRKSLQTGASLGA